MDLTMDLTNGPAARSPNALPPEGLPANTDRPHAWNSSDNDIDCYPLISEVIKDYELYINAVSTPKRPTYIDLIFESPNVRLPPLPLSLPPLKEETVSLEKCRIEDKLPIVLCEFLAYLSAFVYMPPKYMKFFIPYSYPAFTNVEQFNVNHSFALGFLFQDRAHIIFRGTVSLVDWRRNLCTGETKDQPARHSGFVEALSVVGKDIEAWIETLPKRDGHPFVLSGHSLGGAMAVLAAYDFHKAGRKIGAVVTFGAPAVGKSDFVLKYNQLLRPRTWRVAYFLRIWRRWASPKTTIWSTHSSRIDPISRSAKPFCQGEAGAIGLSRMPMARNRRLTAAP
jgi:pimeloyl-ACP methyl ester carboxylesterase